MKFFKLTYFIFSSLLFLVFSCKSTRYVPDGYSLLDKNELVFTDDKLNIDEINTIIRQQPNRTTLGFKFKLLIYNSIDSTKVAHKHQRNLAKVFQKNKKKKEKQDRINSKRIIKAKSKGDSVYTQKIIPLRDTVNITLSFREWIKYKRGEKPVLFDSLAMNKSADQLTKYLKKKGYYYGSVNVFSKVNNKNRKKTTVNYTITSGKPYYIDSFYFECSNPNIVSFYNYYIKKQLYNPLLGERFDEDLLDAHRIKVAKFMRDNKFYGFSPSNISFEADTSNMKLKLKIQISERQILKNDSAYFVPFRDFDIRNVYFHLIDTSYYKGSFTKDLFANSLELNEDGFLRTNDTLFYSELCYIKKVVKEKKDPLITRKTKDPKRNIYVLYNSKPYVRPEMLELQNYLESSNPYKEYYVDRSYNRLMQLELFNVIKPVLKEIEGTNKMDVHYYLVPSKKQSFNVEQRFNNSNGFLGLSASLNYNNKNLFRGSEKLTISFGGGFESQPPVFDETLDGQKIKQAGRSFNTFEIGPSIKLDLPGFLPVMKSVKFSKRHRPRTVLSAAYNYQKRTDFSREIFQLNYMWKFYVGKTQVIQVGVPAAAIKYVRIDPSSSFQSRLDLSNDLFLKNAYSNQFVWENLKFMFEFNNKMSDKKKKYNIVYNASLNSAGWILSKFNLKEQSSSGQQQVFGVSYSRFIRLDNDVIYGYPISKKVSIHARGSFGAGVPRGNNTTSLPFDYSFFAGGSNDNRGWRARSLGPGSYKYYLDEERTATQIGDVRLGMFGEFRYSLSQTLKTAFFIDAGNIWTYQKDSKRLGGQFSSNFYKEIALSTGIGLRLDLTFLIARLDLGIPITNPALPNGSKWIFQSREAYYQEGIAKWGELEYKNKMPKAFTPMLQFGIGYPF